ncbi:MAG: hypothetical protein ACOYJA_13285, partial [Christensenellales bacterium]
MSSKVVIRSLAQRKAAQEEEKRRQKQRAQQAQQERVRQNTGTRSQGDQGAGTRAQARPVANVGVLQSIRAAATAITAAAQWIKVGQSTPINWKQSITLPGQEPAAPGNLRVNPAPSARAGSTVTDVVMGTRGWNGQASSQPTWLSPDELMGAFAVTGQVDAIGQALHKRGYSGQVPDQQDQALELLEAQAQVDAYQAYVRNALMISPELTAQQLVRDPD